MYCLALAPVAEPEPRLAQYLIGRGSDWLADQPARPRREHQQATFIDAATFRRLHRPPGTINCCLFLHRLVVFLLVLLVSQRQVN